MAITSYGTFSVESGGRWSKPGELPGFPDETDTTGQTSSANLTDSLSCAGANFCMAVSSTDATAAWDGSSWLPVGTISSAHALQSVACTGPSFCMAVDAEGFSYRYDGSSWTGTAGAWGSVSDLSCVSTVFCMAAEGGVSQWNGTLWAVPLDVDPSGQIVAVSCPTAVFCMAVDTTGGATPFRDGTWGPITPVANVGAAPNGSQLGGTPGSNASIAPPSLTAVSCASSTWCVAVDGVGDAYSFNGTNWSARAAIDPGRNLTSVSCPTSSSCSVVDDQGRSLQYADPG